LRCPSNRVTPEYVSRSAPAVHINGLEGFWSYAKGKLAKHHGVAPHRFPLYLYEMQFRYHHRCDNLFELLFELLVKAVPTT
jgi:transposase